LAGAGALVGMFMGGRSGVRGLASVAKQRQSAQRNEQRAAQADQRIQNKQAELQRMEAELGSEIERIADKWEAAAVDITSLPVTLDKSDVRLRELFLAWLPSF
jgi:uncharacterized protein YPO0396